MNIFLKPSKIGKKLFPRGLFIKINSFSLNIWISIKPSIFPLKKYFH